MLETSLQLWLVSRRSSCKSDHTILTLLGYGSPPLSKTFFLYSTLCHRNSPTSPRPQNWSAPSRSWASVNSTVGTRSSSYDMNNKYISNANSCVDVLNINCVAIGLDSTGSGGYAVLKGSIMAAPYKNKPNISNYKECCTTKRGWNSFSKITTSMLMISFKLKTAIGCSACVLRRQVFRERAEVTTCLSFGGSMA